ncbi:RNA-guided endonuclease TnpB family protein [Fructilactobacillus sanfranciscensis]|uniref:RNA-guided endonuclease TnpB family protein n=1 Tax=Fructilactobacillus sanfranciscensis TaxID=1625 RepID=UPI0006EFF7BD|nr:RNA-guided endonuclease TnpB family protein [Fructilactobacillus sanfranciscensis]KRM79077.1 transposase, IS605 OrfB family [Fructilactobacillus sanfranciscensis DSM 20451]POH13439.1 transposase [Fructilactobacillus sanfranciscensis]POH21366.1 transposase [Fructilactobacillus sanfranciscensis DSM 20451]QFX94031.1 IS200/IS605 family element transposase accessory protein TnpB [Fructilactobacillus sanfranciscensis]RDX59115.1 transposase [Fructilactobacillus sanfranciscensis]
MTLRAIKTRIYPNQTQQDKIIANFGCCRFVWNQLLNMQIKRYNNGSSYVNEFGMNYLIKCLKQEYPLLKQAESTSLLHVSRDLHKAFQKLFKEHVGYPKFKSRKFPKQSYQSNSVNHNIQQTDKHAIKLPKLGNIRFKAGRQVTGKIKNVTIRLSATGKYYAIVLIDEDILELPTTNQSVGIDMGVADLMITSDGVKFPTIRFDKLLSRKKHYWEKRLARRRLQAMKEIAWDHHNKVLVPRELSDFSNYLKAKHMVAKYNEKIANQRNNYLHNLTKQLVEQYDVIKIEDLKTKNLLRNHKLARAIANQSWRELRSQLEYKCAWYGKQLVTVNPRKTSQICSNCGYDDGKHTLDIRQWICPQCGVSHDRDINAAKNILSA